MADPEDGGTDADVVEAPDDGDVADAADAEASPSAADAEEASRDELRERVEEAYDFEDFGPRDMAEMSADEWEVAFDDDAWVTGEELLDRVEADLRSRVATRDVFAVLERAVNPPRLVAYSDEGYAVVGADGSVEGRGTVLRDVKPSVALASMPDYEVQQPPEDHELPTPDEVPQSSGGTGNLVLQVVAGALLVCGLVLLGAPLFADMGGAALVAVVAGLAFVLTALFLGLVVANARLSSRFRAEEYRDRLRAAGVAEGERPDFLPLEPHEFAEDPLDRRQPDHDGDDHAVEG